MLSAEDEAGFWAFYQETSQALFRKAFRMCRGHEADAEDAVQRTYLKALGHWKLVSDMEAAKCRAWLATTLLNEARQMWREQYRSRESSEPDAGGDGLAWAGGRDTGQEDEVLKLFELRRACQSIALLEGRELEVMALHCLAGYEVAEVAEMLGITAPTVRVHLHRARARVKAMMAGGEDDDRGGFL